MSCQPKPCPRRSLLQKFMTRLFRLLSELPVISEFCSSWPWQGIMPAWCSYSRHTACVAQQYSRHMQQEACKHLASRKCDERTAVGPHGLLEPGYGAGNGKYLEKGIRREAAEAVGEQRAHTTCELAVTICCQLDTPFTIKPCLEPNLLKQKRSY